MKKKFSSSILLWMRADQPRQTGMDYWKGPHSKIISASKGTDEYRQLHLAESNPGLWPAISGVETRIPVERRIDGVAEVTFESLLSVQKGRPQTRLAFKDEINVFRRTIMYLGLPTWSRWYDVAEPAETVGARVLVYLRKRDGIRAGELRRFIDRDLAPALARTGVLKELRTQNFLPWNEALWNTPDVAHDNPAGQRFHASLILGFADTAARDAFLQSEAATFSAALADRTSAIHAYEVSEALTYVKDGVILPQV
jgi:hypothetical protein